MEKLTFQKRHSFVLVMFFFFKKSSKERRNELEVCWVAAMNSHKLKKKKEKKEKNKEKKKRKKKFTSLLVLIVFYRFNRGWVVRMDSIYFFCCFLLVSLPFCCSLFLFLFCQQKRHLPLSPFLFLRTFRLSRKGNNE